MEGFYLILNVSLTLLALIDVCGDVHEYLNFPPYLDYWKQSGNGMDIGVIWSDKVFAVFTTHYTSIPRLWAGKSDSSWKHILTRVSKNKCFCISDGCRRPRFLSKNTFVLISSKGGLSASHLHPKSNKCRLRRISRIERVLEEQEDTPEWLLVNGADIASVSKCVTVMKSRLPNNLIGEIKLGVYVLRIPICVPFLDVWWL